MSQPKTNIKTKTLYWGILAIIAFPFIAIYYGLRMIFATKYRQGLRQRLTLYNQDEIEQLQNGPYLWVHAVSLGELNAAKPLIQSLKQQFPQYKILVSTVTETGQNQTQNINAIDYALYLPLDLFSLCNKSIQLVQPKIIIIFETELWPNFLRAAFHHHVPTYLVNARLSDESFGNYKRVRKLFLPLLNEFQSIMAQSEQDYQRFLELGVHESIVKNAGNIKFDSAPVPDQGETRAHWRQFFQVQDDELLLVAGSTFPGEELILAEIFQHFFIEKIKLRLLIAPRHTTRIEQIINELDILKEDKNDQPFEIICRSKIDDTTQLNQHDIILLDTTGELSSVYAAADLVFIGKSLTDKGGQNPIEPAAWGKPILFGPNMQNFRDISAMLLRNRAAIQIKDVADLKNQLHELCTNITLREQLGNKAQEVVKNNQGTLQRIIDKISPELTNKL